MSSADSQLALVFVISPRVSSVPMDRIAAVMGPTRVPRPGNLRGRSRPGAVDWVVSAATAHLGRTGAGRQRSSVPGSKMDRETRHERSPTNKPHSHFGTTYDPLDHVPHQIVNPIAAH